MSAGADADVTGERIEALLGQIEGADPQVAELAEEVVREVLGLYGAGLGRILEVVREAADDPTPLLERFAGDELLAGLLALHDLHPVGVRTRVEQALDKVRPSLGSTGGDVEVLGVSDGVVRLRLVGADGCGSSRSTLEHAVEGAIMRAAPEVSSVEFEGAAASGNGLIPPEALTRRPGGPASDGGATFAVPRLGVGE